jgi:hypothetical protein
MEESCPSVRGRPTGPNIARPSVFDGTDRFSKELNKRTLVQREKFSGWYAQGALAGLADLNCFANSVREGQAKFLPSNSRRQAEREADLPSPEPPSRGPQLS